MTRLPTRPAPPMFVVRQRIDEQFISDPLDDLRKRLKDFPLSKKVKPGQHIAITAGSRGMPGFDDMLRVIVEMVRECGGEPFLVPAMGSHGGATAKGQISVLAAEGITEDTIGVPIRATMETISYGRASNGAEAYFDRNAAEADGVIVLAAVKLHSELRDDIASGLCKMTAIGLGKQRGAQQAHVLGLYESIKAVSSVTLQRGNITAGVAVVFNAKQQPAKIAVIPPDQFYQTDRHFLQIYKQLHPRIPFDELDVLVVDWMGKNISGSGMDPSIIGWWRLNGGDQRPNYRRVVVLNITPESLGNAIGIGMADFTTERLVHQVDWETTYINILTANYPDRRPQYGMRPLPLACDREAIEAALHSADPLLTNPMPRIVRCRATNHVEELLLSEGLLDEAKANPNLEILSKPEPWPYDAAGNLI